MNNKITILFLAVLCLTITSCSTDIEINDPALQTKINGELFRTSSKKATIYDDGTLVISGTAGDKTISFTTSSTQKGTYKLAQQTVSKVSFQSDEEKFISENEVTEGEVEITEIYNNEVTGRFYFKNLKDSKGNSVNFDSGWFYKVPIENGVIEEEVKPEINPCLLNATLTAVVNGEEMITDDHSAEPFGVESPSIRMIATNAAGEIELVLPSNTPAGEYSLTGSGDYSATYKANTNKSSALSGKIIVTEHNTDTKCITGSFEFESRSGIQVTEGVFDFGY